MTRFARAKGSKSSNEKVPEEATPWSQLKRGMIMKQEALKEETKAYVSTLKAKTEENQPMEWVNFDDENDNSLNILKEHLQKGKETTADTNGDNVVKTENGIIMKRKKMPVKNLERSGQKEKKKKLSECQDKNKAVKNMNKVKRIKKNRGQAAPEDKKRGSEVLKKQRKENFSIADNDYTVEGKEKNTLEIACSDEINQDEIKEKIRQKKRKLVKKTCDVVEGDSEERQWLSKKKRMKTFAGDKSLKKNPKPDHSNITNRFKNSKKDMNAFVDYKLTTDIGGEMVTLMKFQGFYVKEEDAKRLKELRRRMTEEGIPQSQIEAALKLERRRCEKALARMKKNVCFQCRKPGHILSQCPESQESVDTTTGVCYKCGSAEHTAFYCKVTKGQKFPFAECFICKEKGHIAKECPDNPRGLYPKGGCCKICGDVTHLKKDCPKRISDAEEKTIKLGVVDNRNLEGLDDGSARTAAGSEKKQKKKPVRF